MFSHNQVNNLRTIEKYEEALIKLKKIELHPSLQSDQKKYLIDIYFNEDKMQKWKKKCQHQQSVIKEGMDKQAGNLK